VTTQLSDSLTQGRRAEFPHLLPVAHEVSGVQPRESILLPRTPTMPSPAPGGHLQGPGAMGELEARPAPRGCLHAVSLPSALLGARNRGRMTGLPVPIRALVTATVTKAERPLGRWRKKESIQVPPRLELGLLDSESRIITTRSRDHETPGGRATL